MRGAVLLLALALALTSLSAAAAPLPPAGGVVVEGEWESIGPDGGDMHFVYVTRDQVLFASHGFGGVWRSADLGETWELIYNPEWVDLNFLAMDEADGVVFGGGNCGIWESRDGGRTWARVATGDEDIDSSPARYEVVSIVALSEGHLYFAVRLSRRAIAEGFRAVRHGFFELRGGELSFHELPERGSIRAVVMLAYDRDFGGRELLFVSSSDSGLYAYDVSSGRWEKILDKRTTRVSVDSENDRVYVGTIGDWYYRCTLSGGKWRLEHITVPRMECRVASFIAPDPYNPDRLWIGTETGSRGSLYQVGPKEERVREFVAVGFWRGGRWYDLRVDYGWAPVVAIVRHKEGEDPSKYMIKTEYGVGARIAFVPRPARGNIQRTTDGGRTWERSYSGIYADTINKITLIESGLRRGHLVVTCVSGTQISRDLGDSWEGGIDFTIGDVGYGLPGYAWGAASPSERLEGRYDLLIATGYPPSYLKGNGVYAVDTEALRSGAEGGAFKRILEGPCFDLVVVGDTLYVGRMDRGVSVVDLRTYSARELEGLPEDEAGINVKYFDGVLVVCTIKGGNADTDYYFFADARATGGVYVIANGACREVYRGKRAVSASLHGDELVILTVEGKVLHFTNFVKDWERQLPRAVYSDMAVDWENRVAYFSTFDGENPGVLYGDLDHLEAGLKPLEGILTRMVRCLLLAGGYLFAGTEGHSVWRFKITRVSRAATYTLTLSASKASVAVGEAVTLSGELTPPLEGTVRLLLSVNGSEYSEVGATALSEGRYAFSYTPRGPGTYRFKAACYDASGNLVAESEEVVVEVSGRPSPERLKLSITISLSKERVTVGEAVEVSGTISPPVPRVRVLVVVSGPGGTAAYPLLAVGGRFSLTLKPAERGTWTIYARVEGTKRLEPATSNTVTLTVEEKRCVIATAAFGSELSPEVEFLRRFRDEYVLSTFAGRSFYLAFDAFYYSWSPHVARAIAGCEAARAAVRAAIYPLLGILRVTAALSLPLFQRCPELASLLAGLVASTLIGAVYVAPAAYLVARASGRRRVEVRGLASLCLAVAAASLALTGLGLALSSEELTAVATSAYVLSLMSASAAITLSLMLRAERLLARSLRRVLACA